MSTFPSRLYSKSGCPLTKKQFARAAKISMPTGEGLSENLIEIVFNLFDKAGKIDLTWPDLTWPDLTWPDLTDWEWTTSLAERRKEMAVCNHIHFFSPPGDDCLSYEEFFVVMKNRLRRQVRRSIKPTGWDAFKNCVKDEIKIAQVRSQVWWKNKPQYWRGNLCIKRDQFYLSRLCTNPRSTVINQFTYLPHIETIFLHGSRGIVSNFLYIKLKTHREYIKQNLKFQSVLQSVCACACLGFGVTKYPLESLFIVIFPVLVKDLFRVRFSYLSSFETWK